MDHISLPVTDAAKTRAFYEPVLAVLGWQCSGFRDGAYVAFKKPDSLALYFQVTDHVAPAHLAFKAKTRQEVAAFHDAGIASHGRDHGAPGPRPGYGRDYYAAFLLDPDGHNVEAVIGGVGG